MSERCSMNNVKSVQNPIALISVLLTMLLHEKIESDHNKREADKSKKEAELLKKEIKQMKKDWVEKSPSRCDNNESERMITDSSPSLLIEGRISLRGYNHPESVTIQHSLPEDLNHSENLRREGMDFDKKITIADTSINVHKDLLSARIPYFKNLLALNWKEFSSDTIILSCGSIIDETICQSSEFDPTILEILINWAYNGILSINQDTVQWIMRSAKYLLTDTVADECCKFMGNRIEYDGLSLFSITADLLIPIKQENHS